MAAIPTTELDSWFSDPDTTATSWEVTRDVLENAELFWVTTVRENGRPHATPLVAVWLVDALHFCTGATEQKGVNLRTDNHVVLMTGCNDGDDGIDVVVEATPSGSPTPIFCHGSLRRGRRNGTVDGSSRSARTGFAPRTVADPTSTQLLLPR